MAQSKNWVFTKNVEEFSPENEPQMIPSVMKYLVYGRERAETGQCHYQGFVQLWKKQKMHQVKDYIEGNPHVELMRGNSKEAAAYCRKEGDFEEFGEFTDTEGGRKKGTRKERCGKMLKAIESGEKSMVQLIHEEPDELKYIKLLGEFIPPRRDPAKVLYLWGESGKGKTYSTQKVLNECGLTYFKKPPGNKWFDGYRQQDVLIMEEFTSCLCLTSFLSLCDPEPPVQEVKGGHVSITSKWIIILTNINPCDQYQGTEQNPIPYERRQAFFRRLNHTVCVNDMLHYDIEASVYVFIHEDDAMETSSPQASQN